MRLRTVCMLAKVTLFAVFTAASPGWTEISSVFERQAACQDPSFIPCYPAGTSSLGSPDAIEDPMLYLNSMTLSGISGLSARHESITKRQGALCCNQSVQCLVLKNYNIPFCYDPVSTAFGFSDGSGGIIATGETVDAQGNTLNLYTGDYKLANGKTGNYYTERNLPIPNTSTIKIPQATSSMPPGSSATSNLKTSPSSTLQSASTTSSIPLQSASTSSGSTQQNTSSATQVIVVNFKVLVIGTMVLGFMLI